MNFEIIHRDNFFEIQTEGVFDSSRFTDLFDTLFHHEEWECNYPILYDHSHLNVGHLSAAEMLDFIRLCEQWRVEVGRGKCAFVTPGEDQYTFVCMFMRRALFTWDVEMEAFRTRNDAFQWLFEDVPSQYVCSSAPAE